MLRSMIFIDHMNFDIGLREYYNSLSKQSPRLDYNKLHKEIALLKNTDFMKSFIFIPKPDDFLMQDRHLNSYYNWVTGMNNAPFTDVIDGRYVARPVIESTQMNLADKTTYYKEEKGTDVNLAVHAVHKAFSNSYDV